MGEATREAAPRCVGECTVRTLPEVAPAACSPRESAYRGARDIAPILIGVLPFATIAGAAAAAVGATPIQSFGLSAIVFAGTAELAVLELFSRNAPATILIVTALIINLRFAMYGASLATLVGGLPRRARALFAYLLTDQAYAVSTMRMPELAEPAQRGWYYVGAAVPMWCTWQTGHAAGFFLGAAVPPEWSLEFTVPLALMAMVAPNLRDRVARRVALVAAVAVPLASWLPFGLGLVAAILLGVGAGIVSDRRAS